jgi:hypothetical protein
MRTTPHIAHRAAARDSGVRRLRRATALVAVGGGALAVGVAALAAKALPGHTSAKPVQTTPAATTTTSSPATPPTLVPAAQAAPAPPASAPVQSSAPPVASSGGT